MHDDSVRLHRRLVAELAAVQAGLLGMAGSTRHPQLMFHLNIPDEAVLWFLVEADSDLQAEIDTGASGHYCLTGHRHDFHASLMGPIRPAPERQGLERVWSTAAEIRFPGGLGDLEWLPLRMDLTEAAIWESPDSAVVAGMDMILPEPQRTGEGDTDLSVRGTLLRFGQGELGKTSNI